MAAKKENWFERISPDCFVSSVDFVECWKNYDTDGNGYIDGTELDKFFEDLLKTAVRNQEVTPALVEQVKRRFMSEYDDNKDGRIEMSELAKILPTDESFLALFRRDKVIKSSKDFMTVWKKYCKKGNEFIATEELKNFLNDLAKMAGVHISSSKLDEYAASITTLFDANHDGKLSFKELSKLLPVQENYLLRFKKLPSLTKAHFEKIFHHYDKDGNGSIENQELDQFLRDVAETIDPAIVRSAHEMENFKRCILKACDTSKDGKLQKDEIAMWLGVQ